MSKQYYFGTKPVKYYPAQYEPTEHPELTLLRALQPKRDPQGYKRTVSESPLKSYYLVHSNAGKALQVVSVIGTKTKVIVGNDSNYMKKGKPNLSMPVMFTLVDTTADHSYALDTAIDAVLNATTGRPPGVSTTDSNANARAAERYANGMSITDIATLEGVSRASIYRRLEASGAYI